MYNFDLKVGGKDGSLEYVPEEKPELKSLNLEKMSREELVKTLEEVRQSGFTQQPKASVRWNRKVAKSHRVARG